MSKTDAQVSRLRKLTVTAVMGAMAAVLQVLEFSVPIIPSFVKFDFSDLPALVASFSIGPMCGVVVELLKNFLHLPFTNTGGVGELANFLIGAPFVLAAGLIYKYIPTKGGAAAGALAGSTVMAIMCLPINYFITYPFYAGAFMPMDVIISSYQAILPWADSLIKALLVFNVPFTLAKGLLISAITIPLFDKLAPMIRGRKRV